jgi:hypothetical protein
MADDRSGTLIDAIQRDHREVEQMLEAVESASGDGRHRAFEQLAAKLKAHEAAEQKVVHPLTAEEGDAEEAQALRSEESKAAEALTELEGLDVDSPEFERGFARLKADVLAHAQEEERDELPGLLRDTPDDELRRRRQLFEDAERDAAQR